MLRLIVLLLVLLNAAYLAWGQGWLLPYGLGPVSQREPQRLAQQVRPEAITLLDDAQVLALAVDAAASTVCLQSGRLDAAQADAVRGALQGNWPAGAWLLDSLARPERWIIYMGKYANAAELAKKREQLLRLRMSLEPLRNAALAPGLSLGGYESQSGATAALAKLSLHGVRTARVVLEQPASVAYRLRLPNVDDTLKQRLASVTALLPGQALTPCPASAP